MEAIVSTEGKPAQKAKKITGATPVKSDTVTLGQEAWERRKADVQNSWADWKLIGGALLFGRQECMKKAGATEPSGRKYNELYSHWLEVNGFGDIDSSDRSKLLQLMENLQAVETWRETLTEDQRARWNHHPYTVFGAWTCKDRGNRGRPRDDEQGAGGLLENCDTEEASERVEQISWQANILLRANKAIGDANLHSEHWLLPEPPEPGTIAKCREVAAAWTGLADALQQWADKSPEELAADRQSYSNTQALKKAKKAKAKKSA
jgi:hypothetical protein